MVVPDEWEGHEENKICYAIGVCKTPVEMSLGHAAWRTVGVTPIMLIDDLVASGLKPLPVPAQQSLTRRFGQTGNREWTALTSG